MGITVNMLNDEKTDDKVKLKLVEPLMGEGMTSAVAVNIDASTNTCGGYEFVRPGTRMIEIMGEPSAD